MASVVIAVFLSRKQNYTGPHCSFVSVIKKTDKQMRKFQNKTCHLAVQLCSVMPIGKLLLGCWFQMFLAAETRTAVGLSCREYSGYCCMPFHTCDNTASFDLAKIKIPRNSGVAKMVNIKLRHAGVISWLALFGMPKHALANNNFGSLTSKCYLLKYEADIILLKGTAETSYQHMHNHILLSSLPLDL